jgi:hypothetical protein
MPSGFTVCSSCVQYWEYVCRTATNILITVAERVFIVGDLPRDRCDLGLFQIGLRAIQYALRERLRVPVSFRLPIDPPTAPQ